MADKEMKNKLNVDAAQIEKIRQQVFTMANSYAGVDYGHIAQMLHVVCNDMITVNHTMIVEAVREPMSVSEKEDEEARAAHHGLTGE